MWNCSIIAIEKIIDQGILLAGVAQEFGLGKSTISDLQRDRKYRNVFSRRRMKKSCFIRRDNEKDYIVPRILVYSERKLKGTPLNGPLVMDKYEILYT